MNITHPIKTTTSTRRFSWLTGAMAIAMMGSVLSAGANPLPLKVVGNRILNSHNEPVTLRGVNAASMEWSSDGQGHILKTVNVAIQDWHANIVRLPLSEDRWFGKGPEQTDGGKAYRALVHKITDTVTSQDCYILLDLHWNDMDQWGKNIGQHKMPDQNSVAFWKDFAPQFRKNSGVLFDLYNEPHDVPWDLWLKGGTVTETSRGSTTGVTYTTSGMQGLLDTIRATGARNVVVCGGIDWAYDMSGFLDGHQLTDPNGNGVIYANHAYTGKRDPVANWISKMETVTKVVPVIISEFGDQNSTRRSTRPNPAIPNPVNNPELPNPWVTEVIAAIKSHGWNFTAWDLHPNAGPCLISDWNYTPTPSFGKLVKQALAEDEQERLSRQPAPPVWQWTP